MSQIKSGKTKLNLDNSISEMIDSVLKKVVPNAERLISDTFEKIERDAVEEWPRRKPTVRRDKSGKVVFWKETSKESWKKFEIGKRLEQGKIVFFLRNTAPYSWAIKYGYESNNYDNDPILQPRGKKPAQELLVKPMRKQVNKIVKQIANDLDKEL